MLYQGKDRHLHKKNITESQDRCTHKHLFILDKDVNVVLWGKEIPFKKVSLKLLGIHKKTSSRKIIFKQITDLNIKSKSPKHLEENMRNRIHNLRLDKIH